MKKILIFDDELVLHSDSASEMAVVGKIENCTLVAYRYATSTAQILTRSHYDPIGDWPLKRVVTKEKIDCIAVNITLGNKFNQGYIALAIILLCHLKGIPVIPYHKDHEADPTQLIVIDTLVRRLLKEELTHVITKTMTNSNKLLEEVWGEVIERA